MSKRDPTVRERPIIFSCESVRAILDGRKTQTRRLCKRALDHEGEAAKSIHADGSGLGWIAWFGPFEVSAEETVKRYPGAEGFPCPHGVPGDRLWVRETWGDADHYYQGHVNDWPSVVAYATHDAIQFDADPPRSIPASDLASWNWDVMKWRPPIFMPRDFSRIDLEITDVRVQRLQDITEGDAKAEGVETEFRTVVMRNDGGPGYRIPNSYRGGFANGWNHINGKRATWESNPWVWAIAFDRIKP